MKLKKYSDFIKESLKEEIKEGKLWKLSEDDIREYLIDLTDNGYIVTVTFGFLEKTKQGGYKDGKWVQTDKDVFAEKVLAGENVRPSYWILIQQSRKITDKDVSESLRFTTSIISEMANAEISIHDTDGNLGDTDGIIVKGGLFYTDNWNSREPEVLEVNDYIAIFAKQKDTVKISVKDLVEFYGWKTDVVKDETYFAEIELEDLANNILSSRSDYKDSVIKGQEHMWDYYEMQYYEPEIDSLFSYTLEKETKELLTKALIKEFGGFDQVKHWEKNSTTSAKGSFPNDFKTEEELVEFLVNERHNGLLKKWIKTEFADSEVYREVTDTVANWEMSAHCDENYQEIIDEFDEIVESDLGKFTKVTKEVTKYYYNNNERREYKTEVTYYQFPYSNDWIETTDSEYLYNKDIDDIFSEFLSEQNLSNSMYPRLSDYGSADDKKMNEDIRSYLGRYLSK
jgi:hypothetical protein